MRKNKTNKIGFLKLLKITFLDVTIKRNWKYNVFLIILLLLPSILSKNNIIKIDSNILNIFIGAIIAIITSININEGYIAFCDKKEWYVYREQLMYIYLFFILEIDMCLHNNFLKLENPLKKKYNDLNESILTFYKNLFEKKEEQNFEKIFNELQNLFKKYTPIYDEIKTSLSKNISYSNDTIQEYYKDILSCKYHIEHMLSLINNIKEAKNEKIKLIEISHCFITLEMHISSNSNYKLKNDYDSILYYINLELYIINSISEFDLHK
ncbi:MAG: hypothetical protein ACPKNR_13335 [Pleomorphochaeta sp.]